MLFKFIFASFILFSFLQSGFSQNVDSLSLLHRVDSIVNHGQELSNEGADRLLSRMTLALDLSNKYGWQEQSAYAEMYLGIGHFYKSQYDSALAYLQEALKGFEILKNLRGQAEVCNELGVFYSKQEDYENAYKYYGKAQELAEANQFQKVLAISLSNQGQSYFKRGFYDQAYPLMFRALELKTEIQDSIGMGYELKRLATYYFAKENYDKGVRFLNRSSEIRKAIGDQHGLAINTVTLAEMYHMRKKYDLAIFNFKKTYDEAQKIEYTDLARYTLDMLHLCYSEQENFQEAYNYQTRARKLADSVLNDRKNKAIAELQTKYQSAEKEQQIVNQKLEIAENEADLQTRNYQIAGLIGGLVIIILFGFIFYNQYRAKQNQKLQAAILAEKERGFESVIQATEEERKRISKDLHDGIGQQLSALKMALSNIATKTSDEGQREDLELITEQFTKSAEEVRQVSHQMMPRTLMDFGLINAIEDLLQNNFKFSDIKYEFEHRLKNLRFDERIEISLYRILQELINNIIKHSEANEVSVQLIQNTGKLLLFVEDNGKGMNNTNSGGHGLLNIKSRLDMVKGSINYEPSPSSGTSATISIPVA